MSENKSAGWIILLALIIIFAGQAVLWSFTQDDAFISYRYARNFLNGQGLVYNEGERVEGYTHFLFLILLILGGSFGIDYILLSKLIGVASGAGILIISFLWSRRLFDPRDIFQNLMTALLLTANAALAYWAISGLETTLFTLLIFAGLYFLARNHPIFIAFFSIAALVRPEGILIYLLAAFGQYIFRLCSIKKILFYLGLFILLVIPHIIFRLVYYGDIFPNPFYAKTGFSGEYVMSGLAYFLAFIKYYGFYGLLLVPLLFYSKLPRQLKLSAFVAGGYIIYIVIIGGDVLSGVRFFITILPILYMLLVYFLNLLSKKRFGARESIQKTTGLIVMTVLTLATVILPFSWMKDIRKNEIGLVTSMTRQAEIINQAAERRFTIACSTIGAFGYYSRARIIDVLGLTDKTIAKDPKPYNHITSTWKERHYNIPYVMNLAPDLILFSTGLKPSAPAEKALFLSERFRKMYYPVFQQAEAFYVIYRKKPNFSVSDSYFPDTRFINLYAEALNFNHDGLTGLSLDYARRSLESGPADFYLPYLLMGEIYLKSAEFDKGAASLIRAVEISDGYATLAAHQLGNMYYSRGDSLSANYYYQLVVKNNRIN